MIERWIPPPGWGNYTIREFVEIPLPDQVSLYPATAAWWWPLGFVLLLIGGLTYNGIKLWRRNRYRREALARLATLRSSPAATGLPQLPVLLKATALHAYGRADVAALHGDAWLNFLSEKVTGLSFAGPAGDALLEFDYLPSTQWTSTHEQQDQLFSICSEWIRRHVEQCSASVESVKS